MKKKIKHYILDIYLGKNKIVGGIGIDAENKADIKKVLKIKLTPPTK